MSDKKNKEAKQRGRADAASGKGSDPHGGILKAVSKEEYHAYREGYGDKKREMKK
tara:strand:+ start:796 stop:960 length:165 start_codon:yes stop_codon:yes gene_type:complete